MSIKSGSDKVLRRPIKIGIGSHREDSREGPRGLRGTQESQIQPNSQTGVDRMLMPARVKKNAAPFTIRRPNFQVGPDPSQRMTHQQGSIENRDSSEKQSSEVSLPFLNTLNLTKTNSHEQRNTVGTITINQPSVQSHKPNMRFFNVGNDTINPRLSEDNQSGASVDSGNRKRRMITLNPIEYDLVDRSLREKKDSIDQGKDNPKNTTIKLNARLKILRPSSRDSTGSNGNNSKQSIRSGQISEQMEPMSRNTSIQSLGQKINTKLGGYDKRYQRPSEIHSPLMVGQNITVHQQAKQKEDIQKRLGKAMQKGPSNSEAVHLPKLTKPFDRASRETDTRSEAYGGEANCRRRTADGEQGRDAFVGSHQPRIMKQNIPYKPLSSHAASRPTKIDCPGDLNTQGGARINLKAESETKSLRRVEVDKFDSKLPRRRLVEEPLDPLDDNLFFADFDNLPLNKKKSRAQTEASKPSPASNKNHTDETNFDSGSHGQIRAQYFDSFGKKGELDEMVLKDQTKDSGVFNISESQQMNFTFGNSNFNRELLQNNSSVLKLSNSGMLLETVEEEKQRDTATIQARFNRLPEFGNDTPPVSQKSQRIKIPIKIVSSASKLSDQGKGEVDKEQVVRKSSPIRPPKVSTMKHESSPGGTWTGGVPLFSQLKPEKLEFRKQNNH